MFDKLALQLQHDIQPRVTVILLLGRSVSYFIIACTNVYCKVMMQCLYYGPQTKKIDILKINCKVFSYVEVGLIKKTLSWQQISRIPCSRNLKICYQNPCIPTRWSMSFNVRHILHTGAWLRGEHSGKCYGISCNSIMLQVTNCLNIANQQKMTL